MIQFNQRIIIKRCKPILEEYEKIINKVSLRSLSWSEISIVGIPGIGLLPGIQATSSTNFSDIMFYLTAILLNSSLYAFRFSSISSEPSIF